MRKYVVGILLGFCLSFAIGANAEVLVKSLIGQTVQGQFPVTVNGVKLEDSAAVIDNNGEPKGYLPIRAIGDSLGVEITFDSNLGIFINGKPKTVGDSVYSADSSNTQTTQIKIEPKIVIKNPVLDGEIDLDKADVVKKSMQEKITSVEYQIRMAKASNKSREYIAELEKGIENFKDAIAEIERQKIELSKP